MKARLLQEFPCVQDGEVYPVTLPAGTVVSGDLAKTLLDDGLAEPTEAVEIAPVSGVLIVEDNAPATEAQASFDPTTSPIAEVRKYLTENGKSFSPRMGEAKLREIAVEIFTQPEAAEPSAESVTDTDA